MPKKKSLPKEVVDFWPEVFKDISIDVVPIEYLDSVLVRFEDGKVWEIDVKSSLKKPHLDIETAMADLFDEYEEVITNIDFRMDTEKVKRDVQRRVGVFMKKRK